MRLIGFGLNEMRFDYNEFMIEISCQFLNSLGFIADGIHTLDNRRPDMPFDFAGQGQEGNDYLEDDYDYVRAGNFGDGYGFAS